MADFPQCVRSPFSIFHFPPVCSFSIFYFPFPPSVFIFNSPFSIFITMKKNVVKEKSFELAVAVVETYKYLTADKKEYVMSKQLLRSGTAPGALIREAEQGESRKDFIHKMAIALKECNETEYWLDLLRYTAYLDEGHFDFVYKKNKEVLYLLISIVKTAKLKMGN